MTDTIRQRDPRKAEQRKTNCAPVRGTELFNTEEEALMRRALAAALFCSIGIACSVGDTSLNYRIPAEEPDGAAIACALTDAGCYWDVSIPPINEGAPIPWRTEITPLPECVDPWSNGDETELQEATGAIQLDISSPLQPSGCDVRIDIVVHTNTGTVDRDLDNETARLRLELPSGASVVDLTPLESGRAVALLRFESPGNYTISASLEGGDERIGVVEVLAYRTKLPIWEITIEETQIESFLRGSLNRAEVVLSVDGQSDEATVSLYDSYESGYTKRSWRIETTSKSPVLGGRQRRILRSEWNDDTMFRNYLASEMFRNGTWLPTPEIEPIHFRVNGIYYGVMWNTEAIDADFLEHNGINSQGSLYHSPPAVVRTGTNGNLTVLPSRDAYLAAYELLTGSGDYQDLIEFIERINWMEDLEFVTTVDQILNVEFYLVYTAMMAIIQDEEHAESNFYIYRDPEATDDRWFAFADDMDLSFGHVSVGPSDARDQTVVSDRILRFGNRLMSRMYGFTQFDSVFVAFIEHILDQTFTREFIDQRIDNLLCRATRDIIADKRKSISDFQIYLERVEQLRTFVDRRRAFILSEIENQNND